MDMVVIYFLVLPYLVTQAQELIDDANFEA